MIPNVKISAAVAAILGASTAGLVWAQDSSPAQATAGAAATANDTGALTEVVVTSERRTENIQDVPITVQAITGAELNKLNVTSFNDLMKYTPNVTFSGNGPGTGNIFMRGMGGIGSGNQSQGTTAAFPNVGVYLDDQSLQFPARNLDVYVVDMERIEVLEGPQGTLFGGGAQAGAVRYITNKPKLDVTSGDFNAGYGYTSGGDPNSVMNATLNIPLIADTLAIRAVAFSEHRGGYISNVAATIAYQPGSVEATLGGNPDGEQLARAVHRLQPGGLPGCTLVGAVEDQRQLECPAAAELPEPGERRVLLQLPDGHERGGAAALPDHGVHPGLQQGPLREHRLDPEWKHRGSTEGGLHRQLPHATHRRSAGLLELRAQHGGSLLRLHRPGRGLLQCEQLPVTRRPQAAVLLPGR